MEEVGSVFSGGGASSLKHNPIYQSLIGRYLGGYTVRLYLNLDKTISSSFPYYYSSKRTSNLELIRDKAQTTIDQMLGETIEKDSNLGRNIELINDRIRWHNQIVSRVQMCWGGCNPSLIFYLLK